MIVNGRQSSQAVLEQLLEAAGRPSGGSMSAEGFGEERPLEDNATANGRARNRRVEFLFVRPPEQSVQQFQEFEAKKERLRRLLEEHNGPIKEAEPPKPAESPEAPKPEDQAPAPSAAKKGPIF